MEAERKVSEGLAFMTDSPAPWAYMSFFQYAVCSRMSQARSRWLSLPPYRDFAYSRTYCPQSTGPSSQAISKSRSYMTGPLSKASGAAPIPFI